ncbi:hypothetical protein GCM10007094_12470 [Pseudovibrio japonicus]|uniref:Transposase n=1 Tax=Pseudovibrio japonicus TaxID=366534 RepID=A0ABQ3E7Q8_9HYPH|nr:hypothetical protein GCM10007094_12470 [Pseudovibrio japonicus]
MNIRNTSCDRVFDRDHAQFCFPGLERVEAVFKSRARDSLILWVDGVARHMGVGSHFSLKHDFALI